MNTKSISLTLSAGLFFACGLRAEDAKSNLNETDKRSYAVGLFYGKDWKRREITPEDLNLDKLFQGLKDGLKGDKPELTDAEMQQALNDYQSALNTKIQEKRKVAAEKNKQDGETFLAANKSKPGVVTTESGLQYKILAEGSGDSPKREDTVVVKYRGTVVDGTEFDSSANAPEGTRSFAAGGVIAGWTEALLMMKPGAKWQLFIPSDLAYKEQARSAVIGPNSTLIFDVELVSVQVAPPPPPPAPPLTSDIIKVPSLEEMKKGAKIETIKAEDVEKLQKQGGNK
jgi:FKBP-type peptidyl-prolyl cis-trans isomerase FklB